MGNAGRKEGGESEINGGNLGRRRKISHLLMANSVIHIPHINILPMRRREKFAEESFVQPVNCELIWGKNHPFYINIEAIFLLTNPPREVGNFCTPP